MIYAKKKKYFRTSVKAQQPRYSQRSSSSTRSAMINTQGNTSQGRATSKKNTQERVREAGGKSKNKNQNQKNTPKPKKKKTKTFSPLSSHILTAGSTSQGLPPEGPRRAGGPFTFPFAAAPSLLEVGCLMVQGKCLSGKTLLRPSRGKKGKISWCRFRALQCSSC